MSYTYTIPQEFLDHRQEKFDLYNRRGRDDRQFLMDLDAEFYEWKMINEGMWEAHDDWKIDGVMLHLGTKIDVKFIKGYYNISPTKMCNILQQRRVLDGYLFMEWVDRPNRPVKLGDTVSIRQLGFIDYDELVDAIKPSFKTGGHYVDVRRLLEARV